MPSKATYFAFFIGTSLVLIGAQIFVYFQLRRILRRDFSERSRKWLRIIRWIFFAMNLPLVFLFFRKDIKADLPMLTNILLYPFTIWEFLILLWAIILIPITIIRLLMNWLHVTSSR